MTENNSQSPDFRLLSDEQVVEFLVARQTELDAEDLTADEILEKVKSGHSVVERESEGHAVAVVSVEDRPIVFAPGALIWLVYVNPDSRRKRVGQRFVREILRRHAREYWARVYCFGPERATFFGRCGFKVVRRERETGLREMVQWR